MGPSDWRASFLKRVKYDCHPGLPFKGWQEIITIQESQKAGTGKLVKISVSSLTGAKTPEVEISAPATSSVILLTSDKNNNIYLVLSHFNQKRERGDRFLSSYAGYQLDENLREIRRFNLIPRYQLQLEYVDNCKTDQNGDVYLMI